MHKDPKTQGKTQRPKNPKHKPGQRTVFCVFPWVFGSLCITRLRRVAFNRHFCTTVREVQVITYFHTFSYIYAVSNGYCSAVMDTALALIRSHKLEACPVAAPWPETI